MKISIEEFKKKYPHLAEEVLGEEKSQDLNLTIKKPIPDPWRGYIPGPIDYIRRCKTVEEALEVLDYLEKHGEINSDEANELRRILKEKGLGFFGSRKEDNYYYRKAVEYWKKLSRIISEQRPQQS
ncbi:DUF2095 family protein [Staphylothermus hellenicus]|uniref:DUF2095 domain-containing protein n=1 Tax=Staphylothermus hellenicus (strain DSM 12710 / JCM 10830 / BK20S6-10-b1 / P8) TaxID=591019 RepID=D7DAB0_STAHD|nr:DUF2095 family protein [Staphylothermus hellenicus]ADI32706.1 conserved hypothetical protein [Staphylothermus hellenicus DSM 12710]